MQNYYYYYGSLTLYLLITTMPQVKQSDKMNQNIKLTIYNLYFLHLSHTEIIIILL
jgi:hypothetical protein